MIAPFRPSPRSVPLLALGLCALFSSGCRIPSASLGPIKDLSITFEVDQSASFVTGIIPVITLECETQDRGLIKPLIWVDEIIINPRVETESQGSRIQLKLSVEQGYAATAPDKRFYYSSRCRSFARFYLNYADPSGSKSIVAGTTDVLADGWVTKEFAKVESDGSDVDLTLRFEKALQGTYRIRCGPDGTSGNKPVNSLFLSKHPADPSESEGRLISSLDRPCTPE